MRTLFLLLLTIAVLMAPGGPLHAYPNIMMRILVIEGKRCLVLADGVLCPGEGPKCVPPCTSEKKDDRPVCPHTPPMC